MAAVCPAELVAAGSGEDPFQEASSLQQEVRSYFWQKQRWLLQTAFGGGGAESVGV